ncbi:hypothetical protein QCA50_011626 [Cerrena zonata]|uniref:Peptidase A2 domain-containing protein n=1 Tax=Cerrena zonata TaxID=2478898 RepID=A0AAW0G5J6_9APHY
MTHHLQDVLKLKPTVKSNLATELPKPVEFPPMVATSFTSKTRGTLIKLRMECDGNPVSAIIDTGSQLNIAHKRIWKSTLSRPVDMHHSVNMSDASGGESVLKGLVSNVPLTCGSVVTHANLYVGDRVPFDLLLGRPWQRGNFVSIDERSDGTYLLFKDQNLDVQHELLVTPEENPPSNEESEFIDRTRNVRPFKGKVSIHKKTTLKTKFTEKVTHRHVKDEKKSECDHCPQNGHNPSKCRAQHQRKGHEDTKTTERDSERREVSTCITKEKGKEDQPPQSLLERLSRPCTTCGHTQTPSRSPTIEPTLPDPDATTTSTDEDTVSKGLVPTNEEEDLLSSEETSEPKTATRLRGGCSGSDDGGDWELCEKFERRQEEITAAKRREVELQRDARVRYRAIRAARKRWMEAKKRGGEEEEVLQPSETLSVIGANEPSGEQTEDDNDLPNLVWEEEPITSNLDRFEIQNRRRPDLPRFPKSQISVVDANETHAAVSCQRGSANQTTDNARVVRGSAKSKSGCGEPQYGSGTILSKKEETSPQDYPEKHHLIPDNNPGPSCLLIQNGINSACETPQGPKKFIDVGTYESKRGIEEEQPTNQDTRVFKKPKTEVPDGYDSKNISPTRIKVREGIAALFDNRRTYIPTSLGFILEDKNLVEEKLGYKTSAEDSPIPGLPVSVKGKPSSNTRPHSHSTSPPDPTMTTPLTEPSRPQLTFEDAEFYANFSADYDQLVQCVGKGVPLGPGALDSLRTFIRELSVEPTTSYSVSGRAHLLQPPDDAQHLVSMIAPGSTLVRHHDGSNEDLNISRGLALITFVRDSFIERWDGIRVAQKPSDVDSGLGLDQRAAIETRDRERTVSTFATLELPKPDEALTGGDHQAVQVLLALARAQASTGSVSESYPPHLTTEKRGEGPSSTPSSLQLPLPAPRPSLSTQTSAANHAAVLDAIHAEHNEPSEEVTQLTRVASPCGSSPYSRLIWVTHDGDVSVTSSPSPPPHSASLAGDTSEVASVFHVADAQLDQVTIDPRQLHPAFTPIKKRAIPRRPTPYPSWNQRQADQDRGNGISSQGPKVHGMRNLARLFAIKLKLLTSAYSPASPTPTSYSLGSLDTLISEDTNQEEGELDERSFAPIINAFPAVPNNSPLEVWISSDPEYSFTVADMVRFQQDAQSSIMPPLAYDDNSRLRFPLAAVMSAPPSQASDAHTNNSGDPFLLGYPSTSSIQSTPPFLPTGTFHRHDTSPVPSTISSWMDDIEPYDVPMPIDNSYAAQFDPATIYYEYKTYIGYDPTLDKDFFLDCQQMTARTLKTAEDHVRLYQRKDWLDKRVMDRPTINDPQAQDEYIKMFVVPNNDDPRDNLFMWGVERCHARQCIRWLNDQENPSPYDLIIRDDLIGLLSYQLNDPGAIEYVNARRNRGDFGPPGGWAPLQTRIDLELADYHGGFLRLR